MYNTKQLLDEVEHDIMNHQNRGLCYLPQPSASAVKNVRVWDGKKSILGEGVKIW